MSQSLLLQPAGLYTFYNHLSGAPNGGLLVASNAVIDRDKILSSRRGFQIYGNAMDSTVNDTAHQLLNYKKRLLRHWGSNSGQFLDWDDGSGDFTTFNFTATGTTHTSTTIDGFTSTENIVLGMYITGSNIPNNTTVSSIINNTSITISNAATGSSTSLFTFTYSIEEVVDGVRIKGVEQNGNLYFTSSDGVQKVSVSSASNLSSAFITPAGGLAALDTSAVLGTGGTGFLQANSSCAYRVVWGIMDENNNEILGAPGSRLIVNNPSANSENVTITSTIPQGATTSYFYQLYRTPQISLVNTFTFVGTSHTSTTIDGIADTSSLIDGMTITGTGIVAGTTILSIPSSTSIVLSQAAISSSSNVNFTVSQILTGTLADPSDEMQLAFEGNIVNADLNNGYITVTDIATDGFLGAYLYTNQNSGEGILQSNYPPPLSLDITTFQNYTFYSNTSTKQRLNVSLLSTSNFNSTSSYIKITNGSTINTYYFKSQTFTGSISSGSRIVTNIASTATLLQNQSLTNSNFPSSTYIVSIDTATQITLSESATSTSGSTTFTAGYESESNKYVMISQFATPGQQVAETAASLVRVINRNASETVYAYTPNDGPTSVPGQILLEARNLNSSPFYLTVDSSATTGIEFNPSLSTTQQTNATSSNNVTPNRMYYSKLQQPEAVPVVNFFDIGPQDKEIIRILALRDNLFILKEEGIYKLTGTDPTSFTIYPFDYSTIIQASDSAVVLNNLIYLFSNQGIATISDTGVAIISRPIEDQLIPLLISQYTHFSTATFGVSYETDRSYYLFTVTSTSDVYPTQCFRYNTFTQTWTVLDLSKRCGLVNLNDNLLYLGPTDINYLEQERKNFNRTDYADRQYDFTLSTNSVSGTTIKMPSLTNVGVNDVVVQSQNLTLSQFNRILSKLDNDPLLSPHNYVTTLTASAGVNLSNVFDNLLTKVGSDVGRTSVSGCINNSSQTVTITDASPGVFTNTINTTGYFNDMPVVFSTSGTLPLPLIVNTIYYVSSLNVDGVKKFRVSATAGGSSINTTTSGSGTHTIHPAYSALSGLGTTFSILQTNFNLFVNLLNNDAGVGYHNYIQSSGTVNYEFYITAINTPALTITSPYAYPLIAGNIITYAHIPVTIQFIPQTLGDVSITKHVSEGTFIFEDASFTNATISYSSDLSGNFEDNTIPGLGNGIFGNVPFGNGLFGGNGSGIPLRNYLPLNKQRCRYINAKFQHVIAREIFYLYGLSLTYNPMSQRGWR